MGGNKTLRQSTGLQIKTATFQGPIPPPDFLRKYNEFIPNGAERILAMAENQSQHRQNLEKTVIEGDNRRADRGQIFGFIIALIALLGGFGLIAAGKDGFGIASVLGSLATLTGVFVYGSISRKKEREKKLAEAKKAN
jgi:uncharacterized membrane protein